MRRNVSRLEEDVGIHDHDGLGPVIGKDRPDAVVQRVRLALAALVASQMKDTARDTAPPWPASTSGVWSVLASSTM